MAYFKILLSDRGLFQDIIKRSWPISRHYSAFALREFHVNLIQDNFGREQSVAV